MDIRTSVVSLLSNLEEVNHIIVVKDFTGFLRWDSFLGAILQPYSGHHCPFCTALKQNERAYARCVNCSELHKRMCQRRKEPFFVPCFMGLWEYAVPIVIRDTCVGSLSFGMYCTDLKEIYGKILALSEEYGMDEEELRHCLTASVTVGNPPEVSKAVFRFVADVIAEAYLPYAEKMDHPEENTPEETAFRKIWGYICKHYDDPAISVGTIARACNYSESHVSHVFNSRMTMNLRTYVNYLRIMRAKNELANGSTVSSAAYRCGFNDANYFCSVFREVVGMPPSQYAKYLKEKKDGLPM